MSTYEDPTATIDDVLRQRAEQLAQAAASDSDDSDRTALIVVAVGDERYAFDLDSVREIEPARQITPVPNTPAFWQGVVNLRGSMYPVLNLRTYLKLAAAEHSDMKVALVSAADVTVGLLVDDVIGIRSVTAADLHPPLSSEASTASALMRAITSDRTSVLDLEALLSDDSLTVDEGGASA